MTVKPRIAGRSTRAGRRGLRLALTAPLLLALGLTSAPAFSQIDLSGSWRQRMHEDQADRGGGPEFGDYTGLPINEAARLRAETWSSEKWSVPEHQCEPHPVDYAPHGPASLRIWATIDPVAQKPVAWHMTHHWMITTRTIWMDGRPHPPAHAPHTWMGFSTGEWIGDTLKVRTTHLKDGWLRRNGVPRSEKATLTEYFIRHGGYLTLVSIVEDPAYMTEPLVRTWNWVLDPGYSIAPYPCAPRVEVEHPRGHVAHYLPGTNPMLNEFREKRGLPLEAAMGGAETLYPEYLQRLEQLSRGQTR